MVFSTLMMGFASAIEIGVNSLANHSECAFTGNDLFLQMVQRYQLPLPNE
jgi:hypothetical protein